jgi:hypothetical protein
MTVQETSAEIIQKYKPVLRKTLAEVGPAPVSQLRGLIDPETAAAFSRAMQNESEVHREVDITAYARDSLVQLTLAQLKASGEATKLPDGTWKSTTPGGE